MCLTSHGGFAGAASVRQRVIVRSRRCNFIVDENGAPQRFSADDAEHLVRTVIEPMASRGLRTLCVAYKCLVTGEKPLNLLTFFSTSIWIVFHVTLPMNPEVVCKSLKL